MLSLAPGAVVAGKYRLERSLARGGMGSLWVARDERLRRMVAIKFMAPGTASPEARARFEREAQAAAQLATPHVVQIYDHGIDDEAPFIVMELLEGEDLAQRLDRERRLSVGDTAALATHIGRGLRRAHGAGIVHRDLKPQNVFLARGDDGIVAKILDFGVAKANLGDQRDTTRTGDVIGSPKYMSPEQARGLRAVDHRSDLWSLGVILFRSVTGTPPFDGASAMDIIVKICSEPVPLATRIAPGLPPNIDAFFLRALARDPAQRYQTADDLVDAFVKLTRTENERASPAVDRAKGARGPVPVSVLGSVAAGTVLWAHRGSLRVTLVLHTSYTLIGGAAELQLPDPVSAEDQHYGDAPTRAVRTAADLAPRVPRAEIVHAGAVVAPAGITMVRLAVSRGGQPILDKRAVASTKNDSTNLGPLGRRAPERLALLRGAPEPAPRSDGLLVLPDLYDFGFHQCAPADQRLDHLAPGDLILLGNLHPNLAEVIVSLPTQAPLARATLGAEEAPLGLECKRVTLDTDRRRFTLTWYAELELPSLDAVPHLRIEARAADAPLPGAPAFDARQILRRLAGLPPEAPASPRPPVPPVPPAPPPPANAGSRLAPGGTFPMQPGQAHAREAALAGTVHAATSPTVEAAQAQPFAWKPGTVSVDLDASPAPAGPLPSRR